MDPVAHTLQADSRTILASRGWDDTLEGVRVDYDARSGLLGIEGREGHYG